MITRYAIFESNIPDHRKSIFQNAVVSKLLPAVRKIPGINDVSVSFSRERDQGAPNIVMFLVTTYPDIQTVELALEAPQREVAKSITDEIFSEFCDYRVHHHITETRTGPTLTK